MLHFSALDLAEICAFYTWPVIVFFVALFGVIGWRQRARQRRACPVTIIVGAIALVGDTILASPIIGWFIGEYVRRWQIEHYTYRLDAPRILAGTLCPAGSEVKLSIDAAHGLDSGSVPVPTKSWGWRLSGRSPSDEPGTGAPMSRAALWRAKPRSRPYPARQGRSSATSTTTRCAARSPATCRSPAWC